MKVSDKRTNPSSSLIVSQSVSPFSVAKPGRGLEHRTPKTNYGQGTLIHARLQHIAPNKLHHHAIAPNCLRYLQRQVTPHSHAQHSDSRPTDRPAQSVTGVCVSSAIDFAERGESVHVSTCPVTSSYDDVREKICVRMRN